MRRGSQQPVPVQGIAVKQLPFDESSSDAETHLYQNEFFDYEDAKLVFYEVSSFERTSILIIAIITSIHH